MEHPVLLRVRRGPIVESVHRGSIAAWQDGATVLAVGDTSGPVFLRSSAKPFQALGFVLSGAADAFGITEPELAVACASHGAEDIHVETVRGMLARAGLDETALDCGPHPPACRRADVALAKSGGKPTAIHNNCSGKHAAMVLTATHLDLPVAGYLDPDHPVQRANRDNLALFAGMDPADIVLGTDGCSAPNFALPLERAAQAFARLAAPDASLPPEIAAAARRIADAMTAHPRLVAWTDAGDAALMGAGAGRLVSKLGAEGVQGIGVRDRGLGIVFKIDDGAGRPRLPLAAALLRAAGVWDAADEAALGPAGATELTNCRERPVGSLEVALPPAVAAWRDGAAIRGG